MKLIAITTSVAVQLLMPDAQHLSAQGRGRGGGEGGVHVGAGAGLGSGAGIGVGRTSVGVGGRESARIDTSARTDMKHSEPSVALSRNTQLAKRTQAMLPAGETIHLSLVA